ncbi:hypothetical protein FKP32DRAFT_1313177 [Trametes sanguinea]|nr:hypothetical protein FKP32DRAFT_1313177 [Trametes sanguinea]
MKKRRRPHPLVSPLVSFYPLPSSHGPLIIRGHHPAGTVGHTIPPLPGRYTLRWHLVGTYSVVTTVGRPARYGPLASALFLQYLPFLPPSPLHKVLPAQAAHHACISFCLSSQSLPGLCVFLQPCFTTTFLPFSTTTALGGRQPDSSGVRAQYHPLLHFHTSRYPHAMQCSVHAHTHVHIARACIFTATRRGVRSRPRLPDSFTTTLTPVIAPGSSPALCVLRLHTDGRT